MGLWPKRMVTRYYKIARRWWKGRKRVSGKRFIRGRKSRKMNRRVKKIYKRSSRKATRAKLMDMLFAKDRVTGNGGLALVTNENEQNLVDFPLASWLPVNGGADPGTSLHDIQSVVGPSPGANLNTRLYWKTQTIKFKIVNMSNVVCHLSAFRLKWKQSKTQGAGDLSPAQVWSDTLTQLGLAGASWKRSFMPLPAAKDTRWGANFRTKKLKTWRMDPGQVVSLNHTVKMHRFLSPTVTANEGNFYSVIGGLSQNIIFVLNGQPAGTSGNTAAVPCYSQAKVGILYNVVTTVTHADDNITSYRIKDATGAWAIPAPGIANERIVVDESGNVAASQLV